MGCTGTTGLTTLSDRCCSKRQQPVEPTHKLSHTQNSQVAQRNTPQAPTMHAFLSEQPPDATNDTAVVNEQRINTLDHAMPVGVHAATSCTTPHTHTPRRASLRQAVPCADVRRPTSDQPNNAQHPNRCVLTPCYRTGAREAERPDAVRCELCFGKACFALVSAPTHTNTPSIRDPYSHS